MICFFCKWENVGNNVFVTIVGKNLGCRGARWDRCVSIDPVIAHLKSYWTVGGSHWTLGEVGARKFIEGSVIQVWTMFMATLERLSIFQ